MWFATSQPKRDKNETSLRVGSVEFSGILLSTLGTVLLTNMFTGQSAIGPRPGQRVTRAAKGTIRAKQDF